MTDLRLRDLLGGARRHDRAAARASFGTHVHDPVGRLDDVEVVLDDEHGVALVDQAIENDEQFFDVVEVQAGGRFVEEKQLAERCCRCFGLAARFIFPDHAFDQMPCQFQALRFAARQRRHRLAEAQVFEADIGERLQRRALLGDPFADRPVAGQRVRPARFREGV
mgnify:CR=1 FL=1